MKKSSESGNTRVTITLPSTLVRVLDERPVQGETGHGTAIRRLIEVALHDLAACEEREDRGEREQYIRVWRDQPQTEAEFGWSDRAVAEAMAKEPWESDAAPAAGPIARLRPSDQTSTK